MPASVLFLLCFGDELRLIFSGRNPGNFLKYSDKGVAVRASDHLGNLRHLHICILDQLDGIADTHFIKIINYTALVLFFILF